MSRKTRIVCVSDTHNTSPADGVFKLPAGDVLIHAGDLTNQGTYAEIRKALDWIEAADFEVKIVVAGNHDVTLDRGFYAEYGQYFHNQSPQDPQSCLELCRKYPSIKFLNHESVEIRLTKADGPKTSFKVFGSPYSPAHGRWAFGYPWEEAEQLWSKIPLDADIVVTHTPPKYHCDETSDGGAAGCEILRRNLWRVRPRLSICGHVHEGRGVERILWDLSSPHVKYKELDTRYWIDPALGNKKQCRIDLTARATLPLDNSHETAPISPTHPPTPPTLPAAAENRAEKATLGVLKFWTSKGRQQPRNESGRLSCCVCNRVYSDLSGKDQAAPIHGDNCPEATLVSDAEAFQGRLRRKETCIVNAAIMTSSWSQHTWQGKSYNKPIAVDIDLPL